MQLDQSPRIFRRALSDEACPERGDSFQLGREIDVLFPIADRFSEFRSDTVNVPDVVLTGLKHGFGGAEALDQLPQAHRTEIRHHV
jgi:hypothetical protein